MGHKGLLSRGKKRGKGDKNAKKIISFLHQNYYFYRTNKRKDKDLFPFLNEIQLLYSKNLNHKPWQFVLLLKNVTVHKLPKRPFLLDFGKNSPRKGKVLQISTGFVWLKTSEIVENSTRMSEYDCFLNQKHWKFVQFKMRLFLYYQKVQNCLFSQYTNLQFTGDSTNLFHLKLATFMSKKVNFMTNLRQLFKFKIHVSIVWYKVVDYNLATFVKL